MPFSLNVRGIELGVGSWGFWVVGWELGVAYSVPPCLYCVYYFLLPLYYCLSLCLCPSVPFLYLLFAFAYLP